MRHRHNPISGLELPRTLDDNPGKVPPELPDLTEDTLRGLVVNRVDAGRNRPDQHFTRPGNRLRHVNDLQLRRPHSPHRVPQTH
ncbi:hypothetical protein LFM09_40895 [Lentzea alba]